VLTVTFHKRYQFHYDQMTKDPKRLQATADAILRLFGRKVTVRCVLEEGDGGHTAAHHERVQEALTAFPGSEIEE
jgi:hypothetical protein